MKSPPKDLNELRASVTPKHPHSKRRRDLYPYYAGFTPEFVNDVVHNYAQHASSVLDPWSGSGTTTVICRTRDIRSHGLDINPVLTVIARGRLAPASAKETLVSLAAQICSATASTRIDVQSTDLLSLWFADDALDCIRRIQAAIHDVCGTPTLDYNVATLETWADTFSTTQSFLYTALFSSVRSTLSRFRTTNSMWVKTPSTLRDRVNPSQLTFIDSFRRSVHALADLLIIPDTDLTDLDILFSTGNATDLPYDTGSFDAVITSPPYATRIDYIIGTLPELAILGATEPAIARLRATSTGNPVVRHTRHILPESLLSDSANDLLKTIRFHPSKGSEHYYFPWLKNYLWNIEKSIAELDRTITDGGTICIVLQDSRYKEVHINLQRIVVELFAEHNRILAQRIDHPAGNFRFTEVDISESTGHDPSNIESLLIFR